jgi:hypothetical protein
MLLKYQPDITARAPQGTRTHIGHCAPEPKDLAPIGLHQPGQAAKQGRFARTARPEKGNDLARLDAEADAAEHRLAGIILAEADDPDRRGGQISLRRSQALS